MEILDKNDFKKHVKSFGRPRPGILHTLRGGGMREKNFSKISTARNKLGFKFLYNFIRVDFYSILFL